MGKGGRYLKTKEKKKGRGWKIALIVLAILVVLLGGVAYAGVHYYNAILDLIPRAEYEIGTFLWMMSWMRQPTIPINIPMGTETWPDKCICNPAAHKAAGFFLLRSKKSL